MSRFEAAIAAANHLQPCQLLLSPLLVLALATLSIFATSGFHIALDGDQNLLHIEQDTSGHLGLLPVLGQDMRPFEAAIADAHHLQPLS